MEDYIPLGFPQRVGDTSGKEIKIQTPGPYKPELSTLYITLASHLHKVAVGAQNSVLQQSRQALFSTYADLDWADVKAYAQKVYETKKATGDGGVYGLFSQEEFDAEMGRCRNYHLSAATDLQNRRPL